MTRPEDPAFDVLVIGGGAAGLSTSLVLARSRRQVAVIDAGEPRNAPADGVHNYLGREGVPPRELVAIGRAEVEQYGGTVIDARVVGAAALPGDEPSFRVELDDGRSLTARRIVLATGVVDELPDVAGLQERWGHDVLHCPYCHGWEVRDRRVGVLTTGPGGVHHAHLFRQLTDDVTLLTQGRVLDDDTRLGLEARGVRIVEAAAREAVVDGGQLAGIRLEDDSVIELDALVVAPFFRARTQVATALGVCDKPVAMGEETVATALETDARGATAVPGVWVVGNAADPFGTVVAAAASGTSVGAQLNADLVAEDTRRAVEAQGAAEATPSDQHTEEAWDERYQERVWSGRVNPQLEAMAADLTPGAALEVGCGEGADAIWLAQHGWQVTGVDFSRVGLARAAEHADAAGVTDRTAWEHADLSTWEPGDRRWQLVTSHYLHLTRMPDVVRRLGSAVAPGGTLLVVLHHRDDVPAEHRDPARFATPDELAEALGDGWQIETSEVGRTHTGHGPDVVVRDAILSAARL